MLLDVGARILQVVSAFDWCLSRQHPENVVDRNAYSFDDNGVLA